MADRGRGLGLISAAKPGPAPEEAGWGVTAARLLRLLAVSEGVTVAPPWRRVFVGEASQVSHARRFVKDALDGCPAADTVVLLADELVTNALVHTRSGRGGLFEVIGWSGPSSACVAVLDGGSDGEPSPADSDAMRESGRGLTLVDALATRWGHAGDCGGRVTWFVVRWPEEQHPGASGRAG